MYEPSKTKTKDLLQNKPLLTNRWFSSQKPLDTRKRSGDYDEEWLVGFWPKRAVLRVGVLFCKRSLVHSLYIQKQEWTDQRELFWFGSYTRLNASKLLANVRSAFCILLGHSQKYVAGALKELRNWSYLKCLLFLLPSQKRRRHAAKGGRRNS